MVLPLSNTSDLISLPLKLVTQIGYKDTGGLQGATDLFLDELIERRDQIQALGMRPSALTHGGPGHW